MAELLPDRLTQQLQLLSRQAMGVWEKEAEITLDTRTVLRQRKFIESTLDGDDGWTTELVDRLLKDNAHLARFDGEIAREEYSDAGLSATQGDLRVHFQACCEAVQQSSGGQLNNKLDELDAAMEAIDLHGFSQLVDEAEPLFAQIYERWLLLGFRESDLELL